MKQLKTCMSEVIKEYLDGIGVKYDKNISLLELTALASEKNSSYPYRALGILTLKAVDIYTNQK